MMQLINGDCATELKKLKPNSIDAMITDPPAAIAFMGKAWDGNLGSRDNWIKWLSAIFKECGRVLKPGAHVFVWALPKTSHWTALALEDAGFEIRDVVMHLFGSGFPKSLDISKAIDKEFKVERKIIGKNINNIGRQKNIGKFGGCEGKYGSIKKRDDNLTAPSTNKAKQWNGYGTALKPACEHWILARVPLSHSAIHKNVLRWGTGGLNIDGCRIGTKDNLNGGAYSNETQRNPSSYKLGSTGNEFKQPQGRFPSNITLSHHEECELIGTKEVGSGNLKPNEDVNRSKSSLRAQNYRKPERKGSFASFGTETVDSYKCHAECPVKMLDEQSGVLKQGGFQKGSLKRSNPEKINKNSHMASIIKREPVKPIRIETDKYGASRFFYCAKPSKAERNAGLEGMNRISTRNKMSGTGSDTRTYDGKPVAKHQNFHPTVKPIKLMRYLITMITPSGGIVLDPFMGSGTTGKAAIKSGFDFIGIERDKKYFEIASARVTSAQKKDPA